ncbi:hypothetical protein D7I44_00115 [Gryllotalpicola protaetiae]|uniref:Uncharacterized protein n=1 Tax=Gryllotalpicola protaetiae TaxID=2419771 RepID=A0A387BIV2_9MICO|nr:hypothetical protein D7I44_00115 [Gryllotalpicola protaetiae]
MTAGQFQVGSEVTTGSNVCSLAHDYNMQYSTGSGWVNFPSAGTSVNSPQTLEWNSYPTNMNAGVPC